MRRYSFLAIGAIIFLSACQQGPDPQIAANKALVQAFADAQNAWDFDELDNLVASDLVRHCQATPELNIRSRDEFKAFLKSWRDIMPDAQQTLNQIMAEGDRVAVHATFAGTQTGPMPGIPPTGNAVTSDFVAILRIADNKIAEIWVEWDNVAILQQLGAFPPPPPSEPEAM